MQPKENAEKKANKKSKKKPQEEIHYLTCKTHGKRPGGIICVHLNEGDEGLGFYQPDPNNPSYIEAWCYECELKLEKNGGWPEGEIVENFRAICDQCFEVVREYHSIRKIDGQIVH